MMLVSQAGARASSDGTLPEIFGRKNSHGTPVMGLVLSSIMMSILLVSTDATVKGRRHPIPVR